MAQLFGIGSHFVGQVETRPQMFTGATADGSTLPDCLFAGFGSGEVRCRGTLPSTARFGATHANRRLEFPSLALRSPSKRWLTFSVEGGEDESAEKTEVLQEVHLLLGARRRDPTPPRTGVRHTSSGR